MSYPYFFSNYKLGPHLTMTLKSVLSSSDSPDIILKPTKPTTKDPC